MAWSSPRTWITGETVTAALLNTEVRDNLEETAAAKASTLGGLFIAQGANSLAERLTGYQMGDAAYSGSGTADNTYHFYAAPAWGSGNGVSVTVTTGTRALVLHGFEKCESSSGEQLIDQSYDVAGASSIAASFTWRAVGMTSSSGTNGTGAFRLHYVTTLTAGANQFRLVARSTDISVSTIRRPYLFVLPLS